MTVEEMQSAIAAKGLADKLRKQLDEYVLLRRDSCTKEVICLGDPVKYRENEYHRVEVPLSEELRRYAFRLWQRETTLKYNDLCRKLAQANVQSDHRVRELQGAQP